MNKVIFTIGLLTLAPWTLCGGDPPARIAITAAGEDIHQVLEAVTEQTGYNFVIPESVSLRVQVSLRDVTLKEALDGLLVLNGLNYLIQGKTVLVYPAANAEAMKPLTQGGPLRVRVFELRYVSVRSIKETVEGLLTPRGKIRSISNPSAQSWERQDTFLYSPAERAAPPKPATKDADDDRAHRFMVIDEAEQLDLISEVVAQIDVPKRQVYISAVIFELGLAEEEEIGLRWHLSATITPSSLPWNFPFGHSTLGPFSPRVSPSDPLAPTGPGMFPDNPASDFLFGRIDLSSSNLVIDLRRLGSTFNVISNPRLMVADQEEAVILVGEKYPLLRSTITDQGTVTETFDRYEPIGVQLRVVPHILENGEVSLLIEPQVTALGQTVTGTTGLSYPRIATRRVESKLSVADGKSIVIAGLVSEQDRKSTQTVPLLSEIPILGRLFRYHATTNEKVDLVVIVTPYVDRVPDQEALDREYEAAGLPVKSRRLIKPKAPAQADAVRSADAPQDPRPAAAPGR